jgi:hypothetical protein
VIGIDCLAVVRGVTRDTRLRRAYELSVHVTLHAGGCHMRSGQWKASSAVIEKGSFPTGFRMAHLAVRRKVCGSVVRIRRVVEICRMTTETIRRHCFESSTGVARGTLKRTVSSAQRKLRSCVVIETCRVPLAQAVTCFAGSRETGGAVIDRTGVLVVGRMTRNAGCAQACENAACRTAVA